MNQQINHPLLIAWVWIEATFIVLWADFVLPMLRVAIAVASYAIVSAFWFTFRYLTEYWYRLRLVMWLYKHRDQLLNAILN
jgi:uncharacterized protein (DUF2062 family)